MIVRERKTPRVTNIHIQGDFTRKGEQVSPGVPAMLHPLEAQRKDFRGLEPARSRELAGRPEEPADRAGER